MAKKCIICQSPNRLDIDKQILSGVSLAKISRDYGVPYNSVARHAKYDITRQLATAFHKKMQVEDFNLLNKIDELLAKAEDIFNRNYDKGRDGMALKALAEQRLVFDLILRISMALHEIKQMEEADIIEMNGQMEQAQLEQSMQVLTFEELEIFERLTRKLETQDRSIQVLPAKKLSAGVFSTTKVKRTRFKA